MKSRLATILVAAVLSSAPVVFAQDVAHDTDKAAKDVGHDTKVAGKDTAKGTEKAADKTGHATKTAAKKTAAKPRAPKKKSSSAKTEVDKQLERYRSMRDFGVTAEPRGRKATGGGLPVEIWSRFMKVAHQGVTPTPLPGFGNGWVSSGAPTPPQGLDSAAPANNNQRDSGGGTLDSWLLDKLFGRH